MFSWATFCFAQDLQRLHISNSDPRWGETVTISYISPDSSTFGKPGSLDTLYCAAIVTGARPEHAIVQKMLQLDAKNFEAKFTVPDSTYSLRIEVTTPTERAPDGITIFTCRTSDWKPTPGYVIVKTQNVDSSLTMDLATYPKHYSAYLEAYDRENELQQTNQIKVSEKEFGAWISSLISRMKSNPDNTPAWYLTLASLYIQKGKDSIGHIELTTASKILEYDPIFNDAKFWNHFFSPVMNLKGEVAFDFVPGRIIAPIVERNPQSTMAAGWIRHTAVDTMMPSSAFEDVIEHWGNSHDVDVLLSISRAYAYGNGPLYDPEKALVWCDRAEENWRTHGGFYSGENIWGSMGRIEAIIAQKIHILSDMGKIGEAADVAAKGLLIVNKSSAKQKIASTMAKAYLDYGRWDDAKQEYGIALALSTRSDLPGLKTLYEKCKQGNETQADFAKRLIATYGGNVNLPAIPDFEFTTLDGTKGTLAALRGKVVVIDCWFTMCAGCATERPSLNHLVDSYKGNPNVVFLSIALDDENTLKNYFKKAESKLTVVPDGQDICTKLGVSVYPTHIIVGRDGTTLGYENGGNEKEGELMRPKIEEALTTK